MSDDNKKLIRVFVYKAFTRKAIVFFSPINSYTRTSKIINHRLGRKRAWTFKQ